MKLRTIISLPLIVVLAPFVWLYVAYKAVKRRAMERRYQRFRNEAPEVAAWIEEEVARRSSRKDL